jgi:phenylpropionate dioxygenase-like ring-hydroxylating dioxygenase large terminal subunit
MLTDSYDPLAASRGNLTIHAGLQTAPVPLAPYRSAEFFALERDRVFGRAWLIAGRVEELPHAGDFVVKQIDPCQVSALITHAKGGHIQVFHNSCSHRGSEIVSDQQGHRPRFVCPYHNWTYSIDGTLVGIPDQTNFFDIDKKKCGLRAIATAIWEGWIFINLSPEPEVSLATFLGDLAHHLAGFQYQGVDTPVVFTAELDANWKVVSDAFIESYHIPFIHPETIGSTFASRSNPFARLLSAKMMGPHRAVSMFGNSQYEADTNNQVEMLAREAGPTGSVIAAASTEKAAQFLAHKSVNPTGAKDWSMDVNHVFPHTQIDSGPGGFWTHQFWPLSPNKSRYEGRFYMQKAQTMRERFQQELYVARVAEVILEDLGNVARTQRGIDGGGQMFMQLQDSEIAIRHSVKQVMRWVEADTVEAALA